MQNGCSPIRVGGYQMIWIRPSGKVEMPPLPFGVKIPDVNIRAKSARHPGAKWRRASVVNGGSRVQILLEWNVVRMKRQHPIRICCPDNLSGYTPCMDLLMAKDFKASALHVFELSIALPWIPNNSPQSQICFGDKKAIKTPKLNTI